MQGRLDFTLPPPVQRALWWLLAAVVICLPVLMSVMLLQTREAVTIHDLTPLWSDEVYYWHQVASFREAGFNSGYYTFNERPATAPFAHFYTWGVGIPALYGVSSLAFGWPLNAIPLYNLAFMTLGLTAFILLVRPGIAGLLLTGITIVTFAPFITFHFTAMVTVMELGIALALAGGIYRFTRRPQPRSLLILLAVIAAISLIRSTWALLAFPVLLMGWPGAMTTRRLLLALGAAVAFNGVMWGFYFYTSAPYPNIISEVISTLRQSVPAALQTWTSHVGNNLVELSRGDVLEVHQRGQIAVLVAGMLLTFIYVAGRGGANRVLILRMLIIAIMMISGLMLLAVLAYDTFAWRDFRLMAAPLLMAMALVITARQWPLAWVMIVTGVMILPQALSVHDDDLLAVVDGSSQRSADFAVWRDELAAVMQYDAAAPSAWCNTVNYSISYLNAQVAVLLAVDAGIGLSSPLFQPPVLPFQSRWLMLDGDFYAQYESQLNVQPLMNLPNGQLYRNLDADC